MKIVIFILIFSLSILCPTGVASKVSSSPNFVILFADDLGYGDLGAFGHPTIKTPHLDRMAAEGMKLTQWYSAFPSCSPSRAALLTGRLPKRSGINCVLPCPNVGGMPNNETLIPQLLKPKGYATAAVGKWHLGQRPEFLPTNFGFDEYFGIPYSADMGGFMQYPCATDDIWCCAPLPLFHNQTIIQQPVYLPNIEPNHAKYAVDFITRNKNNPFMLYMAFAHSHVSVPGDWKQWSSVPFEGKSLRGDYGDAVEEMDWCAGQILQALRDLAIDKNTLVIFTSDNGPWLVQQTYGGSAGLFRSGKDTTWEGGIRMPAIAWWPGTIEKASVSESIVSTMDIYVTIAELAGVPIPTDRIIDGRDISQVLIKKGPSPHRYLFFYHADFTVPGQGFNPVFAIRSGQYKIHYITSDPAYVNLTVQNPPLLYDIDVDPSENFPLNVTLYAGVIDDFNRALQVHNNSMIPALDQCSLGINWSYSPCCNPTTNCVCGQDSTAVDDSMLFGSSPSKRSMIRLEKN